MGFLRGCRDYRKVDNFKNGLPAIYSLQARNKNISDLLSKELQAKKETVKYRNIAIYYPTLLRRVQITRETSTNITRYLYSSHSPDRANY